ncbi:MAG: hypothetical protein COB36_00945 [Alphaproteobacteria bacterium]|nr:MAG: hypothetical protein COB36_00945 [Alphaproteobacteria bacterium]
MELKEAFASKNTGIIYPKAAWKKANARIDAEAYAAQYLMTHNEELKHQGVTKPAAAMYVTDHREIHFAIYDSENEEPADVTPKDVRVLRPVAPYF